MLASEVTPQRLESGDVQPNGHVEEIKPQTLPASSEDTIRQDEKEAPESVDASDDESIGTKLERLGRERPACFKSAWQETGFVFSICVCQVLSEYFVSGFVVMLPTLAEDLNIAQASRTWPASAFSLSLASFLLVFGRFSDMYGGYPFYVGGMAWLSLWSVIAGFSQNELMLNFCRALQGLGPAAFLPSSMMMIGSIYRPGPRKNLIFSIYGACAPLGFFIGIFFAGLIAEYARWGWYFWIGTFLSAITAVVAYLCVPSDVTERRKMGIEMDWWGASLSVAGLILFTFAIIDSSHAPQQWRTPYVIATFVLGCVLLLLTVYVEGWLVSNPLFPPSLFRVPYMSWLMVALFFTYGSLGIFLLYATFYMEEFMGASPLQVVAWYVPMALGGCIIATFGGFVLHLLPGTILIWIAGTSFVVCPLLFAIMPEGASYWAYVFPSMICATVGVDITFNISNIFITSSLPLKQQGLAGGVIMLLLQLGIAVFLGFADIVNTYTVESLGERKSYRVVFWFELACAAFALVVLVLFVKIGKAESALTADELEEMEAEQAGIFDQTVEDPLRHKNEIGVK